MIDINKSILMKNIFKTLYLKINNIIFIFYKNSYIFFFYNTILLYNNYIYTLIISYNYSIYS